MNNVNGILLVVGAMAAFALEDMFIKILSVSVPTGQIMIILGLICGLIFAGMAIVTRKRIIYAAAWQPLPVMRAVSEGIGAIAFITALALVDLSTVAAVFQALPLAVTMGAALFLGEQVGWRRWSAVFVGFIGVLLIIRPGLSGFQPETLLVVISVVAIAARDLITRKLHADIASAVVAMQAYLAAILGGAILMIAQGQPLVHLGSEQYWPLVGAVTVSVLGYYGIVTAMRVGDASALTPFRYTRLVFSIAAGMIMFGERPDTLTIAGALLILSSGLYTFLRERRLARDISAMA